MIIIVIVVVIVDVVVVAVVVAAVAVVVVAVAVVVVAVAVVVTKRLSLCQLLLTHGAGHAVIGAALRPVLLALQPPAYNIHIIYYIILYVYII